MAILGLVLLSQAATFTFAAAADSRKVRLAVIDLSAGDGFTVEEGKMLTVFIRDAIVNSGQFEVLDRQRVADILNEQKFSEAFTDETARLVKVGKLLDANRVIGGRVGRFGNNWSLVLSLVDVNLGSLVSSYAVPDAGTKENLLTSAPRAGLALVALAEFIKTTAALPPEKQVAAVIAMLKEFNPQFDGREQHKIEAGAVTELAISTAGVTDISPLRALKRLKKLTITPSGANQKGGVWDLSALQGMPLRWLYCHNNPITDLSPLKGMPLTVLSCNGAQVKDLAPLAGMKLTVLSVNDTEVRELAPLEGMPLTVLWCNNTKVNDLSPLKAMRLQELKCDFVADRDAAILRGMKTLAKINDTAGPAFWMRVGTIPKTASTPQRLTTSQPQPSSAPEKTMFTSTGIELVWIPPGEFMMGSTAKEREWAVGPEGRVKPSYLFDSGEPRRTMIKNGFWLGRTEITVGQWQKFVDGTGYVTEAEKRGNAHAPDLKTGDWVTVQGACWRNPNFGFPRKDNHAVCCISWNDAVAFCEWLTETEKREGKLQAGMLYRLPSEAEWEYACRAGTQTKFWWGDSVEKGKGRLNVTGGPWDDQYKYVSPVDAFGSRGRNSFGLADMLGNVWEWCLDGFDRETAHAEPYKEKTSIRVLRGGSFNRTYGYPGNLRCASRYASGPSDSRCNYGFRVCCGVGW